MLWLFKMQLSGKSLGCIALLPSRNNQNGPTNLHPISSYPTLRTTYHPICGSANPTCPAVLSNNSSLFLYKSAIHSLHTTTPSHNSKLSTIFKRLFHSEPRTEDNNNNASKRNNIEASKGQEEEIDDNPQSPPLTGQRDNSPSPKVFSGEK